ncbi:MAG: GNAT family N-acetyltransferase [Rhodobacteraceae bacterium]|nr:GNAT family N-acetyltransferase [Paracoccaceae bacterium]
MTLPGAPALLAALEATWPAAGVTERDGVRLHDGAGGGKRVSAARVTGAPGAARIAGAEAAMRAQGACPLFMIRPGEDALDVALAARGYAVVDPTVLMVAPVSALAAPPAPITLFPVWPPLQIMRDIWAANGIDAARQAVMDRAPDPRTALIARASDRAAGVAFVGCHAGIAMLHAVEVLPGLRRQGAARNILTGAAWWAEGQGMAWLALAVTRANTAARALYADAGLTEVCSYHYRMAEPG